jgi:hypothetical protein
MLHQADNLAETVQVASALKPLNRHVLQDTFTLPEQTRPERRRLQQVRSARMADETEKRRTLRDRLDMRRFRKRRL